MRRLILLATTDAFDGIHALVAAVAAHPDGAELLHALAGQPERDDDLAARERALVPLAFRDPDVARWERLFAGTRWSAAANAASRVIAGSFDVRDRLGEIRVPTLVVAGRHDVYCPPAHAERLTRGIPGATLVMCERSAHYPFVEEPDVFVQAVRSWLAESASHGGATCSAA